MTTEQATERGRLREALDIARNIVKGKWTCQPGDMERILVCLEAYQQRLDASP
jgi:hypothetical protein